MKALGKDIIEFYDNHFPANHYHDENELETHNDDGTWSLKPEVKYELKDLGLIICESGWPVESMTFQTAFKKWDNTRSTVTFLLTVPKDKEQEVRDLFKVLTEQGVITVEVSSDFLVPL
jgi:hypothetical protein